VLALGLDSFEDVWTSVGIIDSLEEIRFCSLDVVVCHAESFEESEYLLAVLDALLRVNDGYLTAFRMVGSEERGSSPVPVNGSNFVGEVVDVS